MTVHPFLATSAASGSFPFRIASHDAKGTLYSLRRYVSSPPGTEGRYLFYLMEVKVVHRGVRTMALGGGRSEMGREDERVETQRIEGWYERLRDERVETQRMV